MTKDKKILQGGMILLFLSAFLLLSGCEDNNYEDKKMNEIKNEKTKKPLTQETMTTLVKNENLQKALPEADEKVAIMHTNKGDIYLRFFAEEAPKTVENFIGLSEKKYYDGIIFHRIIKDFMMQGGDPTGTGRGGESFFGKAFEDEFSPDLSNIKYSISMANAGPGTNGSQFFINEGNNTFLDGRHSVFGEVILGTNTVDTIMNVKTGAADKPTTDVIIESIDIVEFSTIADLLK